MTERILEMERKQAATDSATPTSKLSSSQSTTRQRTSPTSPSSAAPNIITTAGQTVRPPRPEFSVPGLYPCHTWAARKAPCYDLANPNSTCTRRTPFPHAWPTNAPEADKTACTEWCKLVTK
jgi:hypothetical protein